MAIPKEPAELEARLLRGGQALRQTARAIDELAQYAITNNLRESMKAIAIYAGDVAESVLT